MLVAIGWPLSAAGSRRGGGGRGGGERLIQGFLKRGKLSGKFGVFFAQRDDQRPVLIMDLNLLWQIGNERLGQLWKKLIVLNGDQIVIVPDPT